jgi:hypothetical protein
MDKVFVKVVAIFPLIFFVESIYLKVISKSSLESIYVKSYI